MSGPPMQAGSSSQLEDISPSGASSTGDEIELGQKCRDPESPQDYSPTKSDAVVNVVSTEDIPPDGGYGWAIVLCVFLANSHTWGINSSWAVLLEHYLNNDTFPGATKFQYAIVGGLSISQALMVGPLVVACQGWFGTRYTMLFGGALIFTALFTAASSSHVWQLMLSQGLCFGYGMGFVYLPATAVLPPWFSSRRNLAVGIATSGSGVGGLVYSLVTGRLIQQVGVTWTYRILALCSLLMITVGALLLRERKPTGRPKTRAFNPRHFGRIEILLVVFWGLVTDMGYIALLFSLPTYATSIGLNPTQGSVIQAILNVGLAVGRPVIGYYSDKVGCINMAMSMTSICAVLVFALWIPAHSYAVLIAFALLVGMVVGTFWSAVSPVLAEVAGLVELGSILGSIFLALVVPTTFAEAIAIQLVPDTSSLGAFRHSQIFVGCMFVIGALALFFLRSWKIADSEIKAAGQTRDALVSATVTSRVSSSFWLTPRRAFRLERV